MRVLWITFDLIGRSLKLFYNGTSQSGTWIDASAVKILNVSSSIELTIVALGEKNRELFDDKTRIKYVELSGIIRMRGKRNSHDVSVWRKVIEKYSPDIIQIFGTEFANALDIIEAADKIPVLIFIQGVVNAIAKYKYGGIEFHKLFCKNNPLAWIKNIKYFRDQKKMERQVVYEKEIIAHCTGIICDNLWTYHYYYQYNENLKMYPQYLPISSVFLAGKWHLENISRHTIFTIAGRTPSKGLHNLVLAIEIVKRKYPDVKVFIPGNMDPHKIWGQLPYVTFLHNLINERGVSDNIIFCNKLTSNEMVNYMLSCNVFVMPSCIENHSSTLREAMYLGVPCITSEVGCIHEFSIHRHNSMMYRYEEYEQLACYIIELFGQDLLAQRISINAYNDIRKHFPQEIIGEQLYDAYRQVVCSEY